MYFEPRFAPQLHASADLGVVEVILAVDRGLARAVEEHNALHAAAIVAGARPRVYYGIIVCALRFFTPGFSKCVVRAASKWRYAFPVSATHSTYAYLRRGCAFPA